MNNLSKTILIVDDDTDIMTMLKYYLEKEGFSVLTAVNGLDAVAKAQVFPDLILLDVFLPGADGWEVMRTLKHKTETSEIPILFMTAKASEEDEIQGFELGAVDYIRKPISLPVLLARIRSILRNRLHSNGPKPEVAGIIRVDALEINPESFGVRVKGKEVLFAKKEFELLAYLMQHRGSVLSREALLKAVWGEGTRIFGRTVDVHIRKIREKLGECASYIITVKRVGYRFMDRWN